VRTAGGGPLDAEGALALLRTYIAERHPADAGKIAVVPLSGDASTRRYYRLVDGDRSFVLALYPEPFLPEELSYLAVHGLLESYGLPVPATVDVDGARVSGAIVATGGVVRAGEKAEDVIVLPAAALESGGEKGGRVERREDMAWVELL
jgi:hypothetical protein